MLFWMTFNRRFNQQVSIGYWNLTAFAETLTRYVAIERLQEILDGYADIQQQAYLTAMRARLGLLGADAGDALLIDKLLVQMDHSAVDYTLFFRRLGEQPAAAALATMRSEFANQAAFAEWVDEFLLRCSTDTRSQAQRRTGLLHKLHQVLSDPFTEQPDCEIYAQRPPQWGKHLPISCSS